MLLFYVGENCYAIESRHILRIVPKVRLKRMPYAMKYVAGLLNLAGKSILVVDFCKLIEQRETQSFLNSRIILIQDPQSASERMIGVLGEKVEEITHLQSTQFSKTEFPHRYFSYLDKIYNDEKRVIQYINVEEFFRFLSAEIFEIAGKDLHEH